ncbi:lantibiotic modifying enzyme [Lysinibacillus sp. RC46]|uniref:lanthionine synthetase C family protein n=1 Tax=unclassified Lysinibacillus TaxID=2636778 RepID=UPI003519027A
MHTSSLELQKQCSILFEEHLKNFANNTLKTNFEDQSIHTLSHGIPGLCIFYASLDKLYPKNNWDYYAHRHLEILNKKIDFNIIDVSLYRGISGIGASVLSLAKEGRYQQYLKSLNEVLENRIRKLLNEFPSESDVSIYDVISGISGVVRYMLFFKENNNINQLINELVSKIIVFAESEMDKLSGDFANKNDSVNLGTAHGLSGILSILSIVKLEKFEVEKLNLTIVNLVAFFEKNTFKTLGVLTFPERLPFINTPRHKKYINSSWCYGLTGITRSMILASKAIDDMLLKEKYINNYNMFLNSLNLEKGKVSTVFCHGVSGIIYETFLIYKESGNIKFIEHILKLLTILHDNSDFNNFNSFPDRSLEENYIEYKEGILDGTISVYIVILSILLNERENMDWIFLKS